MTRALVWKELREQWAVWLTVAVAAVSGVAAYRVLFPDPYGNESPVLILWLGAWGYGLVCGSLLLAGETEEQTQAFLDTLPVTRRQLWRTKAGAGLLLLAAQAALLSTADYFFFQNKHSFALTGTAQAGILVFAIIGYVFGLHSGSQSTTVLGGIGRGVLTQAVIGLSVFPFFAMALDKLFAAPDAGMQLLAAAIVPGLITAVIAVRSREIYCRSDRLRDSARVRQTEQPLGQDWDESFRLAWWDARWFALGMAAVSVFATAAMAIEALTWPMATSLIGLVCGLSASVVGAELAGADRTAERRTPAVRHLLARACARLAIGLAASALTVWVPIVLSAVTRGSARGSELQALAVRLHDAAARLPPTQSFAFLPAWLLDGFAIGLLCGSFARGSLGAGLLAVPGVCYLQALLLTTRIGIGSTALDVWSIPAVLLAVAFVSMWVRSGGEAAEQRPRQEWKESFRLAWWDARWFGLGIAAVGVIATASQAASGLITWSITTSFIGFACGLTASMSRTGVAVSDSPGEEGLAAVRRLFARACVYFAVGLGATMLTSQLPLVLPAVTGQFVGVSVLPAPVGRLRFVAALPPGELLLAVGLFNGFTVGLLCGLFARGSLLAGLLAVPGACFVGVFLQSTEILGVRLNAWQEWGVPAVLLLALSGSMWLPAEGKAATLRTTAIATAATLAAVLWLVAVS